MRTTTLLAQLLLVVANAAASDMPDGVTGTLGGESFKRLTAEESANRKFMQATAESDLSGMEAALEAGADIDHVHKVSPEASLPAIMHVALGGNVELMEYLLAEGADADVPDSFGFNAIHGAAFKGHAQIAKMLIEHGVDAEVAHEEVRSGPGPSACVRVQTVEDAKLSGALTRLPYALSGRKLPDPPGVLGGGPPRRAEGLP